MAVLQRGEASEAGEDSCSRHSFNVLTSIMAAVVVTAGPTIVTFDFVQTQVVIRAEHIGSALLHKGHTPDGDKHIGIFSQNRPEVRLTLGFP